MSPEKLDALRDLVGGRGCVVRHGYLAYAWGNQEQSGDVASAVKPVISTLLLLAIQEGKLGSVDDPVAKFEPRLRTLNRGKEAGITWRHLASQTSGYGLLEAPGAAYAYNDFALALYYDTLIRQVFKAEGTEVLTARLADVLGFEDSFTFNAFGPDDRPGRLAVSVRDFARFGLLYLRGGKWGDRQVLRPELVRLVLNSPLPADFRRASGAEADMLPGQRSLGGGKTITPVGPGYYSFNWWLNGKDREGRRLFVDAPPDAFVAAGHGGERMLWVIPSLDLVVCWNDSTVNDQDASPGNAGTRCNQAARLIRAAVIDAAPQTSAERLTRVSIAGAQWRLNGAPTYQGTRAEGLLMNVRMVNAVFADPGRPAFDPESNADEFIVRIPDYVAHGVRAFTIGLQGGFPGYEGAENSAFTAAGELSDDYLRRVGRVIEACDRQGAVVILSCFYQRQDQRLRDKQAVAAAVEAVARWIAEQKFTNVVLEVTNEFGHGGFDQPTLKTAAGQVELILRAKAVAPALLVATSGLGDGTLPDDVAAASDFLLIHFNGTPVEGIESRAAALRRFGKPIVCNEDEKTGRDGAAAARASVAAGVSWGLMVEPVNQRFPFAFRGAADDAEVYAELRRLTVP